MATHTMLYRCPHCGQPHEMEPIRDEQVIHCKNPACGKPFELELPEAYPENINRQRNLIVPNGEEPTEARPAEARPNEQEASRDEGTDVISRREEKTVDVIHPVIFRRYPLRTALFALMVILGILFIIPGLTTEFYALVVLGAVLAGIGLYFLIKWAIWAQTTTLTITSHRTILNHGILNKTSVEVDHDDIDYLRVHKSTINRIMRTGDLALYTKGSKKQLLMMATPHAETTANLIRAQISGEGREVQDAHAKHQRQMAQMEEQNQKGTTVERAK